MDVADSDSVKVRLLWHGSPQPSGGGQHYTLLNVVLPNRRTCTIFPSEHLITAAPVLTMLDTFALSVIVANLRLPTFHALVEFSEGEGESVVSVLISGRLISGLSVTRHAEGQHSWSATSTHGVP